MSIELHIRHTWDGYPVTATEAVVLRVARTPEGGLRLDVDAPFHGDSPPAGPPGSFDGLWDYEVVELFLVGPAGEGEELPYLEIELGPHGHYLLLELRGARNIVRRGMPLSYEAVIEGERWRGTAFVPGPFLPPEPWRANAYAIHGRFEAEWGRRYLAKTPLPGAAPNFHRPEVFPPLPRLRPAARL